MTLNNLDEHLRWLLSTKPTLPPDTTWLPPVAASFPAIGSTQVEEAIAEASELKEHIQVQLSRRPSIAQLVAREGNDMARTRVAPSSASRPRVSVGPRIPSVSPSKAARSPSVESARPIMSAPKTVPVERRLASSPPRSSDHQEIEVMDLTGGLNVNRTPPPIPPRPTVCNTSRKRKSEEFEGDSRTAWASPKRPVFPETSPGELPFRPSQEFVSIDALDSPEKQTEFPSVPPPPYSTNPVGKKQHQEARTPFVHRPQVLAGIDSDDEEDLVNFSVNSRRSRSAHVPATPLKSKRPPVQHNSIQEQDDEYQMLDEDAPTRIEQPSLFLAKLDSTPFVQAPEAPGGVDDANLATPMHNLRTPAPPPTCGTQSTSPELEESRTLLKEFFNAPEEAYERALALIERADKAIVDRIMERVDQDLPDDPALDFQLDELGHRKTALETLRARRSKYKVLLEDKDRLKEALRQVISLRQNREPAKLAIASAGAKLNALEEECLDLLVKCEGDVRAALECAKSLLGQKRVAIKATQALRTSSLDHEPAVPSSSRIAQTQMPPPDRPKPLSKSNRPNHPQSRVLEPAFNNATMYNEDEFEDLDDSELRPADNMLFSTRMGTPPSRFHGDEEEDFGIDEDDEMFDHIPHVVSHNASSRPTMVETSGKAQSRPKSAKKSKTPSSREVEEKYRKNFSFPWAQDVLRELKDTFRLKGFRENQFEAINATLAGKDTFVLMPTGGGKSLCYQLPALITCGKTRGVTVVISPLVSLMEDQVQHLNNLSIQAFFVNSETTKDDRSVLFGALKGDDPEDFVQLLYITPEMLGKSQAMISCFESMYRKGRFARIVIDEAHCVSQWGHDFRKDYKTIGEVRQKFPGVPVMALTATATENVKADTIHNLGIKGCEVFTASFNRPNLYYEVRMKRKGKEDLGAIVDLIKTNHNKQTGVMYCLARKTCEEMAKSLQKEGIKAHHYHAGMEPAEKSKVQKAWQAGQYHVIVATIAFGMGIDKSNVRYVIHHSIPKSLEGYYQETGRAGRDGKPSSCYLFYGYQDAGKLRRMIDGSEDSSREQKARQHQMLRMMTQFCDNKSDCRRVQVLAYFNERFDAEDCDQGCDNCQSDSTFEEVDYTSYADKAINLVRRISNQDVTVLHCVDVFRGANTSKIRDLGHGNIDEYGAGEGMDRGDLERLFYRLLSENALQEHNVVNKKGFANTYVRLGSRCNDFRPGRSQLIMHISASPRKGAKAPAKKPKKVKTISATPQLPLSTNVSSPVQATSKRKKATKQATIRQLHANGYGKDDFVVSGEESHGYVYAQSDESDGFEPVHEAGKSRKRRKERELGPPIVTDEVMDRLNDIHRNLVEEFMIEAERMVKQIQRKHGLKMVPFSNTLLRQMAVDFVDTEEKMLRMRGVDAERVRLFGKGFWEMAGRSRKRYELMIDETGGRLDDDDDENETAVNPHARNVIDLVSDDEAKGGFSSESEHEEEEAGEQSQYFGRGPPANDLATKRAVFNAKMSQNANTRMQAASQSQARESPKSRKHRTYTVRTNMSGGHRKSSGTRKSSSSFDGGGGGGGVRKKTAARKNTRKQTAGGSSRAAGNIFAMPT